MYDTEPILYERQNDNELEFIDSDDINYITHKVYEAQKIKNAPKISIGILGYKNVEQTKMCVSSVLRYTGDIDYELILMDNGSEDNDELVNYYKSVPVAKKKIIKVEKPLGRTYGSIFGTDLMYRYSSGDYFVFLGNDIIITENALQNMIRCLDSDHNIALANPMSSSVYMLQNPMLTFSGFEEMHEKARLFNVFDPRKWEERMNFGSVATVVKREAINRVGFYDFMCEHSLSKRLRLSGYKIILLGDTWVCHNHIYDGSKLSHSWVGNDTQAKHQSNIVEKVRYKELGVDLFKEMICFEKHLTNLIKIDNFSGKPDILSVDVKCGQGMLDLKNKLRSHGIFQSSSIAFTSNAKYYKWLEGVADTVCCDRIEFISEVLRDCNFDYIIVGDPINLYHEPVKLVKKLLSMLRTGGQLLFKLRNSVDYNTLIKMLGLGVNVDEDMPLHISIEDIIEYVKNMGYENISFSREVYDVDENSTRFINDTLKNVGLNDTAADYHKQNVFTRHYNLCIRN